MLTYLGLSGTPSTAELIEARRQKWISTSGVAGVVNLPEAYFHDVFNEVTGATDNDAKNTYWRKFKELVLGGKWGFNQDDLDTIFQNDNNGQDTKEYYVEPNDTNNGNDIFQGRTSAFWYALRLWCKDNIRAMAVEMVKAASDMADRLNIQANTIHERLFGLIEYYMWKKSSKYFPKTIYNEDTQLAYIDVWYEDPNKVYNNVPPLTQIHGDHYETERAWVEKRIAYMFSKFQIGAFQGSSPDGYGTLEFTPLTGFDMQVTPAIWLYPRISIGGGETEQSERTKAGEQCTLALPSSGTTGVYIKGLDWLSDLGDLSGLQLASRGGSDVISFSVLGKRLRRLKVGDAAGNVAFNATILSVAGKCIEEIDAQNASTISGSLDLRECPRLRTLLLAGTSLANIYPPVGGRLLRLQYPDTLSTLFMHSLNLLTEDNIEISDAAKANISTIYINSCDNINAFAFLRSVYNTEGKRLANIGVIWKGVVEDYDATTLVMLGDIAKNAGVDGGYRGVTYNDSGEIISQPVPNISGTIHVNYGVYKDDIDAIAQAHIPITINYDEDKVYIRFADSAVESICATKWGDGVGLTYTKAQSLTSIGTSFRANTEITTFDEFKEFTNITEFKENISGNMQAFSKCTSLRSITLPPAFTKIGSGDGGYGNGYCAFNGCTSLENVNVPSSLYYIGNTAFASCTSLERFDLSNITYIGEKAFNNCSKLLDLVSTSKVETLGSWAFCNCKSLQIISLPSLTSNLGSNTFYNCTSLERIDSLGTTPKTIAKGPGGTSGNFGFAYGCTALKYADISCITSIGDYAFYNCSKLRDLVSTSKVETLGSWAFCNCKSLQIISLPSLTSNLGSNTFYNCTSLERIDSLGTTPKTIAKGPGGTSGNFGFAYGCTALKYADISCITSIGDYAFSNCSKLSTLICNAVTPPSIATTSFSNTPIASKTGTIYVPDESVDAYKTATNWVNYASIIKPLSEYVES